MAAASFTGDLIEDPSGDEAGDTDIKQPITGPNAKEEKFSHSKLSQGGARPKTPHKGPLSSTHHTPRTSRTPSKADMDLAMSLAETSQQKFFEAEKQRKDLERKLAQAERALRALATAQESSPRDAGVSSETVELRLQNLAQQTTLQQREQENLLLRKQLHEQQTRNVRVADIKPTKYSGKADLEDYLCQFESIAAFNGWNDEQKAVVLISKLEGQALTAAAVLSNPSYAALVSHLRENFSQDPMELAAIKLQNLYQGPEDSIEKIALDVRKLVGKAYPFADTRTNERLMKDSFINALKDPTIRDRLRDKNLGALKDCLQEAKRVHANLEVERNRAKTVGAAAGSTSKPVRVVGKDISEPTSNLHPEVADLINRLKSEMSPLKPETSAPQKTKRKPQQQSRFVQGQGKISQKKYVPTCWNCTMLGHTETYCPFPEETVSLWIQQGIIGMPRNRQPQARAANPKSFPGGTFSKFKPKGNGRGAMGDGRQ